MGFVALWASVCLAQSSLLCEWRGDGSVIDDPCPEFYWECEGQTAYRIIVSSSRQMADNAEADMWDSSKVETPLTIAEYEGKSLQDGHTYWWRLKTWGAEGKEGDFTPARSFTYRPAALPRRLPHIRTFLNFGSDPKLIAQRYDLTFRSEAKKHNPQILAAKYTLLATMVVPSKKAEMLAKFCVEEGLTKEGIYEEMFLHYREDRNVTLHVGAERASNPLETRRIPGWDPANDRNGDGQVDDAEFANRVNPRASARKKSQARVPIYYWGPPADDFVMNVGNKEYQKFLAEVWAKSELTSNYDGLFIDTTVAHPPVQGGAAALLEYPQNTPLQQGAWLRDMQTMLAKVKIAIGDKLLLANCWNAKPFVIDGTEWENWLNVTQSAPQIESALALAADLEKRGKIQQIQYNPIYDPKEAEFGVRVPISVERDRIFGLALYYLIAGERTYFGIGQHPYVRSEQKYFPAIEFDVGKAIGEYFIYLQQEATPKGSNLLHNGGFEEIDANGKPVGWTFQEPILVESKNPKMGKYCVRITTDSDSSNSINKQYVTLEPDTYYTLSAWIKTQDISKPNTVHVYPYEFEDASYGKRAILIATGGTHDWRFFSYVFKTGKDVTGRINFRIFNAKGTAWFDDISLVKGAFFDTIVLGRQFDKALVLVRPSVGLYDDATGHPVKLPAPMRPLRMDGSLGDPTDNIFLRSGEAAILVKEQ